MMNEMEETISEEALIEIFSHKYPSLKEQLQALSTHFVSKRGPGVFTPIKGGCCGACRVKIASARLQQARDGSFITCSNCARYMYLASKVISGEMSAFTNHA